MRKKTRVVHIIFLIILTVFFIECSKDEGNIIPPEIIEEPPASGDLIFFDEFDIDGALDTSKWTFEIIPPNNGSWWNGEEQHYTGRRDNTYISNGTMKIVAKKEVYTFQGSTKNYTSARLNSKFSFTYGRIDVKAKLPKGGGTWPAIWTIGSNINSVGWPACGEIDIMEHWGHEPTIVSSATHNTACSGDCSGVNVGKTAISDYNDEFHVYSMIWNENEIQFLIDDELKYTYDPSPKDTRNWPYSADQFIILNLAMGGSWFTIDPDFKEAAMEIDYVRVYKN